MTYATAPVKTVPLVQLRRKASALINWVEFEQGRVWVTRHGKVAAVLVPLQQCEQLERFELRSLEEERLRMQIAYRRWRRAVSAGDGDEESEPFAWTAYERKPHW